MSLEDFQPCEETPYLMVSPKDAESRNSAIADVKAGEAIEKRSLYESGRAIGRAE